MKGGVLWLGFVCVLFNHSRGQKIERLLTGISLHEYVQFLAMGNNPLSPDFEWGLLRNAALEMASLNPWNMDDAPRMKRTEQAVRSWLHCRSGLSSTLTPTCSAQQWAATAHAVVSHCLKFEPPDGRFVRWREICYDAFAGDAALLEAFPHVSTMGSAAQLWLQAAVRMGNLNVLKRLWQLNPGHLQSFVFFNLLQSTCAGGHRPLFRFLNSHRPNLGHVADEKAINEVLLRTALATATEAGQVEMVEYLLDEAKKEAALKDPRKYAALLHTAAASAGRVAIVDLLATRFPKLINVEKSCIAAAASGNVALLVQHMCSEDGTCHNQQTLGFSDEFFKDVLIMAAHSGHMPTVEFLMQPGPNGAKLLWPIDPRARDNAAIGIAANKGHLDIVKKLIQGSPLIDLGAGKNYVIAQAALGGQLVILKYLAALAYHKVDFGEAKNKAIRNACKGGHLAIVQYLMGAKRSHNPRFKLVDPTALSNSCLVHACGLGHLPIVQYLLEGCGDVKGIDPAARNNEAIIRAASNGHLTIVQYLLMDTPARVRRFPTVDPAAQDNEALIQATTKGYAAIVEHLLAMRADGSPVYPGMNAAARNHQPLTAAIRSKNGPLTQFLLALKEDGTFRLAGIKVTLEALAAATEIDDLELLKRLFSMANLKEVLITSEEKRLLAQSDEPLPFNNAQLDAVLQHRQRHFMKLLCQAFFGAKPPAGVLHEMFHNVATSKKPPEDMGKWSAMQKWAAARATPSFVLQAFLGVLIATVATCSWSAMVASTVVGSAEVFMSLLSYVNPIWLQFQSLGDPYWTELYQLVVVDHLQFLGYLTTPVTGLASLLWMTLVTGWSWFYWATHYSYWVYVPIQSLKFQVSTAMVMWVLGPVFRQASRGYSWLTSKLKRT